MNAPFSIGQKVVTLRRLYCAKIKKGTIVTVLETMQCKCGMWLIDIGGRDKEVFDVTCDCNRSFHDGIMWMDYRMFAPIQTNYADATAEIIEKFKPTEDTQEKIIIPEKLKSIS